MFKLRSFVVCEDIRLEFDGRSSLMGVYPAVIGLPTFPWTFFKLGFAISFKYTGEENQAHFVLKGPNRKIFFRGGGEFRKDQQDEQTITLLAGNQMFVSEGMYRCALEIGDKEYKVGEFRLIHLPDKP